MVIVMMGLVSFFFCCCCYLRRTSRDKFSTATRIRRDALWTKTKTKQTITYLCVHYWWLLFDSPANRNLGAWAAVNFVVLLLMNWCWWDFDAFHSTYWTVRPNDWALCRRYIRNLEHHTSETLSVEIETHLFTHIIDQKLNAGRKTRIMTNHEEIADKLY